MRLYTILFTVFTTLMLTACGSSSGGSGDSNGTPSVPLNLDGNTTTLAGDGVQGFQDSTDGTGATAEFNFPRGLTTDGSYLYLSESTGCRVRKIDPVTGDTVNLAGNGVSTYQDSTDGTGDTASFVQPRQITYYNGYLYLSDWGSNTIRKIAVTTGETTTLAGDTSAGFLDSTDGTGATAQFNAPTGITNDGTYLYVSDASNNRIRKVNIQTGETTTLAGDGNATDQESTDGTGATAQFDYPMGIVIDGDYLYVASRSGHICKVNKSTGETTFFAGTGVTGYQDSTDGTGATAQFSSFMADLMSDGTALYVGDSANNRVRRVLLATGETTTVAGDGNSSYQDSTDGTGATAQFNSPRGLTAVGVSIYIADGRNHRVRQIR